MTSRPRPPHILLPECSGEEQKRVRAVNYALEWMGDHCEDFAAAVALMDRCVAVMTGELEPRGLVVAPRERRLCQLWTWIACRDATITIYNFHEQLEAIGINVNRCPPLLAKIDAKRRREATKAFARHFPNFQGMRHSTAHVGRLYGTPETAAEHADEYGTIYVQNLLDRQFTSGFEGKLISCEMSDATTAKLIEVRDLYWSVFSSLS